LLNPWSDEFIMNAHTQEASQGELKQLYPLTARVLFNPCI
jgi:hypothetical protein